MILSSCKLVTTELSGKLDYGDALFDWNLGNEAEAHFFDVALHFESFQETIVDTV